MKRVIVSSILLSLLYGCSVEDKEDNPKIENGIVEQEPGKEEKDLVEESSTTLQKDGKETLAIDLLEEKAMYTFEGKQGNEEYFVYFHAENEVEKKLDLASYLG